MPSILLSYRRADTRWITGRIFDRLERHYGRDHVFMDIDAIPFGLDFRKHIRKILQKCDIMLAIIGPSWLALDEAGRSRLLDETDWVRIEIEAALAKDIPVIPIRVDDAILPHPQLLPELIREIVFRQAAELDAGRDFHAHMDRLIRSMDQLLAELERNPDAKAELPVAEAVALSAPAETLPAPSHEAPPLGVLVPPRAGVRSNHRCRGGRKAKRTPDRTAGSEERRSPRRSAVSTEASQRHALGWHLVWIGRAGDRFLELAIPARGFEY